MPTNNRCGAYIEEKGQMTRAKQIVWMGAIFLVFLPVVVFAGEVDLPKTG
jgi:predicted nucleic acid-binding Zn ribbon protein